MKILANDGIDAVGKKMLEEAGFTVVTDKVEQSNLKNELNKFDVLLVRSATKVTAEIIDSAPNLKFIGRGGVGLDNIDVAYANSKGIKVANTPAASTTSVAELVFSHLFTLIRFLHLSNREMPKNGATQFNQLKKMASSGTELLGKTIGIIGFGRIGQDIARIAIGLGMNVIATDAVNFCAKIKLKFHSNLDLPEIEKEICTEAFDKVISNSDFITINTPGGSQPIISYKEFEKMKNGVGIINCARGGVIDEKALVENLKNKKVAFAGIDVFESEPPVYTEILEQPNVSLSAHIGAATLEAQERVGIEIASSIIDFFKN